MLTSLALIFLVGLSMAGITRKIKLPRIIGMLVTGIVLGPFVLDMLDSSILSISADLRKMALIIILIKAGLSLDLGQLKKVGRPAILLSFVPAVFEIIAYVYIGPYLLGITKLEGAIMGAVLSAVSPAVVVPRMVHLMDHKYGTNKSIPELITAGASCDDIFVIVLFTAFVGMEQSGKVNFTEFLNIPISIVTGIILGAVAGILISIFFERCYNKRTYIRNSMKVIIILGLSFMLTATEDMLNGIFPVSGLLAVLSMAAVINIKCIPYVSKRLSEKFGKLWIAAEVILFVLVGAAVDIRYAVKAGVSAIIMIFIALIIRSLGVYLSLIKTNLNWKERLYCVIAYVPKATVQAAIGSIPLSLGLPCGNIVLSVAVLSILITAPLGAILMDLSYKKLLVKENVEKA